MLELAEIFKSYGSARVLDGASLRCERGQAVCLAGANAAGKTTLLTIAAGVQKADRGEVRCDGTVGYVPHAAGRVPPCFPPIRPSGRSACAHLPAGVYRGFRGA